MTFRSAAKCIVAEKIYLNVSRLVVNPGACPRIRRGRAHGAREASSRREEEAMSMHIVNDEQRRDRPQHPCALWVPAVRRHLRRWRSFNLAWQIVRRNRYDEPCRIVRFSRSIKDQSRRVSSFLRTNRRSLTWRRSPIAARISIGEFEPQIASCNSAILNLK